MLARWQRETWWISGSVQNYQYLKQKQFLNDLVYLVLYFFGFFNWENSSSHCFKALKAQNHSSSKTRRRNYPSYMCQGMYQKNWQYEFIVIFGNHFFHPIFLLVTIMMKMMKINLKILTINIMTLMKDPLLNQVRKKNSTDGRKIQIN